MALHWYGREVDNAITTGIIQGLDFSARRVRENAQKLVPVRTGALRDSLQVEPANRSNLTAAVWTSNPYAVYQHEIFSYKRSNGQVKFLEKAANQYRRNFQRDVMNAIAEASRI